MIETWDDSNLDLSGFFHYMKQPGTSTDNASVSKIFTQLGINDAMLEKIMDHDDVRKFIKSRYKPKPNSLESLHSLPPETLGYQWANLLIQNNLSPSFFVNEDHGDDRTYLINRLHDTHDIWHIILGFDTSEADESGMNAFTYAQAYSPTTCMLMAAKLVRAISDSDSVRQKMMYNISRGYRLGLSLKPFLSVAWEESWHISVRELRLSVGLTEEISMYTGLT
ncbi:MAG: Coq4 family protein [Prochlorococcus sp.]